MSFHYIAHPLSETPPIYPIDQMSGLLNFQAKFEKKNTYPFKTHSDPLNKNEIFIDPLVAILIYFRILLSTQSNRACPLTEFDVVNHRSFVNINESFREKFFPVSSCEQNGRLLHIVSSLSRNYINLQTANHISV